MTVTLNLDGETEKALVARAQERGLSIDEFLQEIAEREAALATLPAASSEDKIRSFIEWADSFPDTPPLSDEAISRASMYRDSW